MLRLMRSPRYLMVWLVVAVAAAACFLAGYWQWQRLHEKHAANVELRTNDHDPRAPVQSVLPVSTADGSHERAQQAQYRQVTATGVYDPAAQLLVRKQSVNDDVGFLVLTPLRMDDGTAVLVVRGFVKADGGATNSPTVAAPPPGTVTVVGRIEPADTADDHFGAVPAGQVDTINAGQAAGRLGSPVLAGYLELEDGQPGVQGLEAIPAPDMSNPAGGAVEPQHLAYVIQWFLFGLLALCLPIILARADLRQTRSQSAGASAGVPAEQRRPRLHRRTPSGTPTSAGAVFASSESDRYADAAQPTEEPGDAARVRAKLADRYGR